MNVVTIAPARPEDADTVVHLFGKLHQHNAELDPRFALAEGWEKLVYAYLQQPDRDDESVWLLAYDEDRAIGFVLVEVHSDSPIYRYRHWAEIVGLYVESDYRGDNVAHLLMEHAYDWAVRHNLRTMQLYVTADNTQAQRFYTRQGFATSQLIMRRTLTMNDKQDATPRDYAYQRLHFSEGGQRPIDMHKQKHNG